MAWIKQFAETTVVFCSSAHQDFAVGAVLAGQADPHPLIISVSLASLPTRLSLPVSWKTMGAVCRHWVTGGRTFWSGRLVKCQLLEIRYLLFTFCRFCKWLSHSWPFQKLEMEKKSKSSIFNDDSSTDSQWHWVYHFHYFLNRPVMLQYSRSLWCGNTDGKQILKFAVLEQSND